MDHVKGSPIQVDWQSDTYWKNRRITPAQIQVHDIRLEGWKTDVGPMLEMKEVLSSTLLPDLDHRDRLSQTAPVEEATSNRNEQKHLRTLIAEYGWLNCLRSNHVQETLFDPPDRRKCRWMLVVHIRAVSRS